MSTSQLPDDPNSTGPPMLRRDISEADEWEASLDEHLMTRECLEPMLLQDLAFLDEQIAKEEHNTKYLAFKLAMLLSAYEDLAELNKRIATYLRRLGRRDELARDLLAEKKLRERVEWLRVQVNELCTPTVGIVAQASAQDLSAVTCQSTLKNIKLPKIEVKQFDGRLTEWLGFWAQFSKIDGNDALDTSDKFQYLVQAMKPGTRARDFVDRYPQSVENYPKVVQGLKERFGKKKMLIQVYVRELLQIVIKNGKERVSVSKMFDALDSKLQALSSLGVTSDQMATFLFPMVESSLPEDLLIAWQRSPLSKHSARAENEGESPTSELDALMAFLKEEVEHEDQREMVQTGFGIARERKTTNREVSIHGVPHTAAGLFTARVQECVFCAKPHSSQDCVSGQTLSLSEKKDKVRAKNACLGCFRPGHRVKFCKASIRCALCHRKHFPIMCPELPDNRDCNSESVTREKKSEKSGEEAAGVHSNVSCLSTVLLKTLVVKVVGEKKTIIARMVLDDGSQQSYIRKVTAETVGCKQSGVQQVRTTLFGGVVTGPRMVRTRQVVLQGLKTERTKSFAMVEERQICSTIPTVPHGPWIDELERRGITLTDHGTDVDDVMEILIGGDYWGSIVTGKILKLECGLVAMETIFGWTLSGPLLSSSEERKSLLVTTLFAAVAPAHELWNLETIGILDPAEKKSREERDRQAKEYFLKTVRRKDCGRYSVALPWVNEQQALPSNRAVAVRRLNSATKKIEQGQKEIPDLFQKYSAVFQAWEDEGIIEKVVDVESDGCHYLPHRPVIKLESSTTPIRPVFDASCKMTRTPSLNDCLERGPNLVELLTSSLLRFRRGRIGVISDIRKAYQMIDVRTEDRDYLRFLWWTDRSKTSLLVYRHCRVVFGVNCSPFLLAAVLELHLSKVKDERKAMAEKFWKSLYVDNSVTSVDNVEELEKFRLVTTGLMADMKMELRQWESNGWKTMTVGQSSTGVLGYSWDKARDHLHCHVPSEELSSVITKRTLLSCLQKIFDPLGFLSPVLLKPKLLLQEAWEEKSSWDEPLPRETLIHFVNWWEGVVQLKEVRVPRHLGEGKEVTDMSLHGFGDASKSAYAAAVFLRSATPAGIVVQLIISKSRVAPLKKLTIPRLELMSSLITARLMRAVKEALDYHNVPTYFWSDSTTALSWIRRNDEWGTFVGNRVKEIIRLSDPAQWLHVPGKQNPADLPSRGCSATELLCAKWWEGPEWLKLGEDNWPAQSYCVDENEVNSERKKTGLAMVALRFDLPFFARSSSYRKNVRVLAYILRFLARLKKLKKRGELTLAETRASEVLLLRFVQAEAFDAKQNTIAGVRVSVDSDGTLRVRTKLLNRQDRADFKMPILLPNCHPIVDQLIETTHQENCHAGIQTLMGILRERYWIVHSRKAVKRVVHRCVRCRRFSAKAPTVAEAALPANRVMATVAFEVTGIDLAGPLVLKDRSKTWIVLFTCAVYRCVHLELVDSLSTEAFLLSLRKFVARRGRPSVIYTDNGRNFVGAASLFREIDWNQVERTTGVREIQWKFIPPSAPWWGGFYERLIGVTKDLLRKTLGFQKLSYFQLEACVAEVESVVNQRPLTFVTECEDDLVPLTPAMFLRDAGCGELPEVGSLVVDAEQLRRKLKTLQDVRIEIRNRFRREYLSQLVHAGRMKKSREFRVGEVVLIGDDNTKRIDWPLGVIVELTAGRDSVTRMGRIKTERGVVLRPIQRLFPLEVQGGDEVIRGERAADSTTRGRGAPLFPRLVGERKQPGRPLKKPPRLLTG